MAKLWLMTGAHDAEGWSALRSDYEEERVEIIHLDPHVWAVIEADEAPAGYTGLTTEPPNDGVYVDPNGNPLYLAAGRIVADAGAVLEALGPDAVELGRTIGDADRALERLGRAF